ncbi:MAG: ABC transporter ATP-binding protein [Clostridia bacterium]|nr:ABC transporter ATP-binding protein [Clostridia bacterium]
MNKLLEIKNLSVAIDTHYGKKDVLRDICLEVYPGEVLAVIGESGCGKTMLCKSIMRLLPRSAKIVSGSIIADGEDITGYSDRKMQSLRGRLLSMTFQDSLSALNPALSVGHQIGEAVSLHRPGLPKAQVRERVIELLESVEIHNPEQVYIMYPHSLSGGMRQRCVIAMALASEAKILLADEPATALDVTVQARILQLLKKIQKERDMAVVLVSHDPGVVAGIAHRVAVMQEGRIVENGITKDIFAVPRHPCTKSLLKNKPDFSKKSEISGETLLEVKNLTHDFVINKHSVIRAVDNVSFSVRKGEIFGLVGESGCGKSTLARCIMNIYKPYAGEILYKGINVCDKADFRSNRKILQTKRQIIFQDSSSSLNHSMRVADIIAEPMRLCGISPKRGTYLKEAEFQLYHVGLNSDFLWKKPAELSGGQRQRVAIARALSVEPELLVADEPLSSLDAAVQAQIVNLFNHLRDEHGFSFVFISHDLSMVKYLCHRAGVMYKGRLVELAPVDELFSNPLHPYTRTLISSVPDTDPASDWLDRFDRSGQDSFCTEGIFTEVSAGHFVLMEVHT